ncbi:MAG: lysophospholipid acyltransferase family protein [Planctomycetota bacterium]
MESITRQQRILGQLNSLWLPAAMNLLNVRIAHYDRSADPARPEYNQHVIYVFWHEFIPIILPHWGHTPLTILVSKHRDGEWVNQIGENLGMHVVRGSSSRGGSAAIRKLKKNSGFSSIAISPDGPRGPRRKMAAGPVFLAAMLGMPIVPLAAGIKNPWRLGTWDKMAVPKPFSRVRMIFGPKIHIPRTGDRELLESYRVSTERLLTGLCDTAQDWAESGARMFGEQPFVRGHRCNRMTFDPPRVDRPNIGGRAQLAPDQAAA